MEQKGQPVTILMADDDADDVLLTNKALRANQMTSDLRSVADGEELMDYLKHRGQYIDKKSAPHPDLILLDLNMPGKSGRQALEEIRADPELRTIPILVLTTSSTEDDIRRSYDLGANSYIVKPRTFEGMVEVMRGIGEYWVQVVALPTSEWQRHRQL